MTQEKALADLAALRAGVSEFCADLVASHKASEDLRNDVAVASHALGIMRTEYMHLIAVIQAAADAVKAGGHDGLASDFEAERQASLDRVDAALCPDHDRLN